MFVDLQNSTDSRLVVVIEPMGESKAVMPQGAEKLTIEPYHQGVTPETDEENPINIDVQIIDGAIHLIFWDEMKSQILDFA